MTARSRILDAAVSLADRIEDAAADHFARDAADHLDARAGHTARRAIGSAQLAVSLTLRLAARRLGRPSFSPLMAWAQGLDDEGLRTTPTVGDA